MQFGSLPIASLVLETPALQFSQWRQYLETFLQDAGGFALLGLWVWLLVALARVFVPQGRYGPRVAIPFLILTVAILSLGCYAAGGIGGYLSYLAQSAREDVAPVSLLDENYGRGTWWNSLLSLGGLLALLGVFVPFLLDCTKMRWGRIWALAKLSFMEAYRKRILLVFLILLLIPLFPPKWWDPTIKPEDEIRASVAVLYTGSTIILMFTAGLLAAFSIPTDIRNQTIHTVVTKPVEKFEIVVGRMLGYVGLLTMVLAAVTAIGLGLLLMSRVDPDARAESMRARVPLYGHLRFQGLPNIQYEGESVGREWDYRKYVPGGMGANPYRAIWDFFDVDLDRGLVKLDKVDCEFAFDIFRTTKGEEGKGVFCTFYVMSHQAVSNREIPEQFRARVRGISPRARPNGTQAEQADWKKLEQIVGELGYFEYTGKEVADYHTESILIPTTLFQKAYSEEPRVSESREKTPGPRVTIAVRCDSRTQFIGVAKNDLYLLAAENIFALNYFKGTLGLWLRLLVVTGVAVICSTYLNGVVTFLATLFLTLLGFSRWFIVTLAMVPYGGDAVFNPGPTNSLRKLIAVEALGATPDTVTATVQVTEAADEAFRWGLRRILNVIPNMERLTWSQYVANGFDVPLGDIALNFVFVLGYLSLWAVLGHYLMKWREIATW